MTRTANPSAVVRTSATPLGSDAVKVSVAPPEEKQPALAALKGSWGELGLAIGEPVEITADGELPEGGVRLTRTYTTALTKNQSATLAYFDEDWDSWRAVPSQLSTDGLSVSAVVHHLSLWTDFVGWVGDAATDAAEWAYYQVGSLFDVRVDSPECTGSEPDWVRDAIFIETHRNNPVLFCTGHDEQNPDLVVVKARVNRGFAFQIDAPGPHAWTYNSSYQQSDLAQARSAIADLGTTFADSFARLVSADGFVAPGAEYSFGMIESAARNLDANQALLLTPPDAAGFLLSTLGQLIGAELELLVDGYAAAAIVTAQCADRFAKATSSMTWAATVTSCLAGFDEDAARALAVYLTNRGMSATQAGQLAGRSVGKLAVYLALVGPVFNAINYGLERSTSEEARTVRIFPGPPVLGVPGVGTGRVRFDHPTWGRSTLITSFRSNRPEEEHYTGTGYVTVFAEGGDVVWQYSTGGHDPAEWGDWYEMALHRPAKDDTGRIFIDWNPGRYNGVTALLPVPGGFADHGTLPEGGDYRSRFYYAEVDDPDGDGSFEIRHYANDCDPSCAGGAITSELWEWTGDGYRVR